MTKTERFRTWFQRGRKRAFIPNSSNMNGKYFSKTDHLTSRKRADISRQKHIIMLAFLSKLTKGKEAEAKPRKMCIFSVWNSESKALTQGLTSNEMTQVK